MLTDIASVGHARIVLQSEKTEPYCSGVWNRYWLLLSQHLLIAELKSLTLAE
jgi:hypothetical protein